MQMVRQANRRAVPPAERVGQLLQRGGECAGELKEKEEQERDQQKMKALLEKTDRMLRA